MLLPTPPLPAPTATTFLTCGKSRSVSVAAAPLGGACAVSSTCTSDAPARFRAAVTSALIDSFIPGESGARLIRRKTSSPSSRMSVATLAETISIASSGSRID